MTTSIILSLAIMAFSTQGGPTPTPQKTKENTRKSSKIGKKPEPETIKMGNLPLRVVHDTADPKKKHDETLPLKKTPARFILGVSGSQVRYDTATLSGPGIGMKFQFHPIMGFGVDFGFLQDHNSDRHDMRVELGFLLYMFEDPKSFMNMYARAAYVNNVIFLPDSFETSARSQLQVGVSAGLGADYRLSKYFAANFEAGYTMIFPTPEDEGSYGILDGHKGWYVRIGFSFSMDFTMTNAAPTTPTTIEPPR
ncbi:hypothetical protein KKF84_05365 [Myxococcota bacterium]|nr:hypothetical protein [Myxococcota bacterium]MBU1534727.1 hypothetical protein [Myxococcota bacterium]